MCDRAPPGAQFVGRSTRRSGSFAEVTKVKTISPHWDLVDAPCEYASYRGGCKTQNLSYEAQVRAKEQQVRDLVIYIGKFSQSELESLEIMKPIVPCDIQFHYRNKMGDKIKNCALGLHAPGIFDNVLNVNKCLLQSEPANMALAAIQDCWRDVDLGLSPYNVHSHNGFLKHLMWRTGRNLKTGLLELMVDFVTSSYKPELLKPLVERIAAIPLSVMNNVNTSVGNASVGEEVLCMGNRPSQKPYVGLLFRYQPILSSRQILTRLVEECAGLRGDGSEIVPDLFCGTGTIGLTLARRVKHVYGYEVFAQAISDARLNANLNDIRHATFMQGDLNKIDASFGNSFPGPDTVISDPKRPGMYMKLIKFLLELKAPRRVYASCNPATCARDLDYLCHGVLRFHNL